MTYTAADIERQAVAELAEDKFREDIDAAKERLRTYRPWWRKVFPWKISVERIK